MVLVARLQSLQRQSVLAARHAAFRPAWSGEMPTPDVLADDLRELHFVNAGWTDPAGRRPLLSPEALSIRVTDASVPGRAAALADHFLSALDTPGGYRGEGLGFGSPGYRLVEIGHEVPPVSGWPPFDAMTLRFSQDAAILGNAWNADGPAQARLRAEPLVPTALFREQLAVLRPFTSVLALLEPALAQFCPGLVEPDRVPEDRLGPATAAAARETCR
jgi:hypothetical protein